jgi:hypothetical protein
MEPEIISTKIQTLESTAEPELLTTDTNEIPSGRGGGGKSNTCCPSIALPLAGVLIVSMAQIKRRKVS